MKTLLTVQTPSWDLSIKSNQTDNRLNQLKRVMETRNKSLPKSSVKLLVQCTGEFKLAINRYIESSVMVSNLGPVIFHTPEPLLFENSTYGFEFSFRSLKADSLPEITHDLKSISESFNHSYFNGVHVLWGTLNTSNSIGWLKLPLRYAAHDKNQVEESISFEVFPTKMDMVNDLGSIFNELRDPYRDWCFTVTEKTSQEAQNSKDRSHFPVMWLQHFKALQEQFNDGVRLITNSPHSRLLKTTKYVKADRLKGKLPSKLEEKVKENLAEENFEKRYQIDRKKLSINTPENRFIKFVLQTLTRKLKKIKIDAERSDPNQKVLSEHFFSKISSWHKPLTKSLNTPFFKDIGSFKGLNSDSLVLQQKSGYSKVYRAWQQLKLYLDLFGKDGSVSIRSIADLYEVWCYLQIIKLVKDLGFEEKAHTLPKLTREGLKIEFRDGLGASQIFEKGDVKIRVAHEPHISTTTKDYKAWTSKQKPDIFLEVSIAGQERLVWVFDAKYRIDSDVGSQDCVPVDALNQMHRYRDALIYLKPDNVGLKKTRPVFGAFALYPGFYRQTQENISTNPYWDAIQEVGVGAFPLLPSSEDEHGRAWLKAFLSEQLAQLIEEESQRDIESYFFQESARISQTGLQHIRNTDLALITSTATDARKEGYYDSFLNGTTTFFHMMKKASAREYVVDHKMRELRYIIIAAPDKSESNKLKANYLWSIKSLKEVSGASLSERVTGTSSKKRNEKYWLFELTRPQALSTPLTEFDQEHHNFKFQSLSELI